MNESISKYKKIGNDTIILDERNKSKFLDELQDGETYIEILQKASKLRSYLQNRYYWSGVLKPFTPKHFHHSNDAHEYFGLQYLKHIDVFEEHETDLMQKLLSKASKIVSNRIFHSFRGNERVSKFEVIWIQSTTTLSTREFNNYIEMIKVDGAELGVEIKEPEEFYN